jgi:hypothetical protein
MGRNLLLKGSLIKNINMKFIKGVKDLPTDRNVIARFFGNVGYAIRYRDRVSFKHNEGTTTWRVNHEDLEQFEWLDQSVSDLQSQYEELKEKYDNILATADGHSTQTENVWQSGYAWGHDAGYEKGKREVQPGPVWVKATRVIMRRSAILRDSVLPELNIHQWIVNGWNDEGVSFTNRIYKEWWELEILDESKQGNMEEEKFTEDDANYMRECDLYPTSDGSVTIITENDEGAHLDKEELMKLAKAIIRFVNQ